ncbi:MAG: PIG-L deacetylase family protein, partial [Planctomycetota bacterium]
EETEILLELLRTLPPSYPVALYEREAGLLPNLLVEDEGEGDGSSLSFSEPADGLRAFRSAFRGGGKGNAEALVLLPARRLAWLLRGSFLAELRPGPGRSLENRRFLVLALDHQRSLLVNPADTPLREGLETAQRVAFVAPHFDDEIIQFGGALRMARDRGAEVRAIWLTDGSRGVAGASREEAALIRKGEARVAMDRLGITDLHFLDAPETRLRARGPWTARLRRLLQEFRPQRVHTVWWGDNHVDHFEANRVLRKAWPADMPDVEIAAGGFWTPVPANCTLALDRKVRRAKDQALAEYASQHKEVDYLRAEHGLARWYGARLPQGKDAEAFLSLRAAEYWGRFKASGAPRRWFLR